MTIPPTDAAPPPAGSDDSPSDDADDTRNELLSVIGRAVVPPLMHDPRARRRMGVPADDDTRGAYMIELNIQYRGGLGAAYRAFESLGTDVLGPRFVAEHRPIRISKSYIKLQLSAVEWKKLLKEDERRAALVEDSRVIYKLWPDFKVRALIDRSVATVKADAAYKSYSASGAGITWAVIDSGIDGTHLHFGTPNAPHDSTIYHPLVADLHYDFVSDGMDDGAVDVGPTAPASITAATAAAAVAAVTGDAIGAAHTISVAVPADDAIEQARRARARATALRDGNGHGTHVAGIIAGHLPLDAIEQATTAPGDATVSAPRYAVFEQVFEADPEGDRIYGKRPSRRRVRRSEALHGVAPDCLLVSLKVLDENGEGRVSDVMRALVFIREELNDDPKMLRVHGVNLSIGYDFDAQMFACGQSPVCVEVDRLVRSGVVVVVAAGNTGYGSVSASERSAKVGLSNTINDPGNAALAITVGSTHRDSPHTYGVSFFSSKGPTGDGRLKPDLVAPGERITSCAAAAKCATLGITVDPGVAAYVDDSGTSMAAPHVSGAIAAFLSIRREFIQQPEAVKRIFLDSATSLGRERYFEGHGLVDLMRAIQSV